MSLFLEIGLFLVLFYVLLTFFFYIVQERLLFYPATGRYRPEQKKRIQPYTLTGKNIQLHGWLVNPEFSDRRLLIYYGGKGEDIFLNIEEFEDIQIATLFVPYRGYSINSGQPGETTFFADALAIIDDVRQQFSPGKIFLMGRSLGTGVACYAAAKREVNGVILVTPFASISALAKIRYPWLPISLLLKHKFLSDKYVRQVTAPFLVLYGDEDTVVPPLQTKKLLNCIKSETKEIYIKGANHGTIDMHPEYWPAILEFLLECPYPLK